MFAYCCTREKGIHVTVHRYFTELHSKLYCLRNEIVNENKINNVQNFQMHVCCKVFFFITNSVAKNYLN